MRRAILAPLAIVAIALGAAACSSTPAPKGEAGGGSDASSTATSSNAIILDVRTPQEFAEGHLDGAVNVDFNAGAVPAALAEMDPNAEYIVYCRSGNRSGQVAALMDAAGFKNVEDLGPLDNAAEKTGIDIVK